MHQFFDVPSGRWFVLSEPSAVADGFVSSKRGPIRYRGRFWQNAPARSVMACGSKLPYVSPRECL